MRDYNDPSINVSFPREMMTIDGPEFSYRNTQTMYRPTGASALYTLSADSLFDAKIMKLCDEIAQRCYALQKNESLIGVKSMSYSA